MKTPHKLHLAQVSFFKLLTQDEMDTLVPSLVLTSFKRGATICFKSASVDYLYFLAEGIVSLRSSPEVEIDINRRKKTRKLHSFGLMWPSNIIGLNGVSDDSACHVSDSVAITPVLAILIKREIFQQLISKNEKIIPFLLSESLSMHDQTCRFIDAKMNGVGAQLTFLKRTFKDKNYDLTEMLSNQDIANIIGSSREIVSRHFNDYYF